MENRLSLVKKILLIQFLVALLVSLAFVLVNSWGYAVSAFMGGLAAFLPNVYFAMRVSWSQGQDAKKIVNAFYAGEAGKLILTAMLFIAIFQLPNVHLVALMVGYVAVLSIFWFALLWRE